MVLTFNYPRYRGNINDRRLWSEINADLIFEQKEYDLKNTIVVITVFKRKPLKYPTRTLKYNLDHQIWNKRKYFDIDQLRNIVNLILTRCNIKFNICEFFYMEKYIYEQPRIKLEFLSNSCTVAQRRKNEICSFQN